MYTNGRTRNGKSIIISHATQAIAGLVVLDDGGMVFRSVHIFVSYPLLLIPHRWDESEVHDDEINPVLPQRLAPRLVSCLPCIVAIG